MTTFRLSSVSLVFVSLAFFVGCGEEPPDSEGSSTGGTLSGTGGTPTETATATGTGGAGESRFEAGATYALTIGRTWQDPDPAVGNEVGRYVPQFLFGVESVAGDGTAQVLVGTGTENVQNTCSPTKSVVATVTPFGITIPEFWVRLTNEMEEADSTDDVVVDAPIYNLTFTNLIPNSASGEFSATMDVRDIAVMFHRLSADSRTGQGVCDSFPMISEVAECQPCAKDGQPFCITLTANRLGADPLPGAALQPIETADATCALP